MEPRYVLMGAAIAGLGVANVVIARRMHRDGQRRLRDNPMLLGALMGYLPYPVGKLLYLAMSVGILVLGLAGLVVGFTGQ